MSVFDEDDGDDGQGSPFRPGYGRVPFVLAGRDELIRRLLRDLRGPSAHHEALYGPRGVGKTALLRSFGDWAATREWLVASHQIAPGEGTAHRLIGKLLDAAGELPGGWRRGARERLSEVTAIAVPGLSVTRAAAPNDRIDLERAFVELGRAARDANGAVLILLDEIQALDSGTETVSLTQALQATLTQDLPVHVLVAGIRPPSLARTEGATFFERIDSDRVGYLDGAATRLAILEPLNHAGVRPDPVALDHLVQSTGGYPYFTQLMGDKAWKAWERDGANGPLTVRHADAGIAASSQQVSQLYEGRWERLGPQAQAFLHAMATTTPTDRPVGLATISTRLGVDANNLGSVRRALIDHHGLIQSTGRGYLRFTLPMFDQWVRHHELPTGPAWLERVERLGLDQADPEIGL